MFHSHVSVFVPHHIKFVHTTKILFTRRTVFIHTYQFFFTPRKVFHTITFSFTPAISEIHIYRFLFLLWFRVTQELGRVPLRQQGLANWGRKRGDMAWHILEIGKSCNKKATVHIASYVKATVQKKQRFTQWSPSDFAVKFTPSKLRGEVRVCSELQEDDVVYWCLI